MATITKRNLINYSISIIACVWISAVIIKQLNHQQQLHTAYLQLTTNWNASRIALLSLVVILMLLNWSIEAIKWKMLLRPLQHITFARSLRSVFTGISISLLTPNRIGEYAGRIIYLKDINKLHGISANIVSSFAQFIAASVYGIAGCIFYMVRYGTEWYLPIVLIGSVLVLIALWILYFRLDKVIVWLEKFTMLKQVSQYMQVVKSYEHQLLLRFILISGVRIIVFTLQYYFLLKAFGIHLQLVPAMLCIFLIFWLMAIIPTIAIAEIPIRTEMSYKILQVFSSNALGIMSASILLWLINLMIPALIGAVVMIGAKFGNKE
jgi:uncharacterized membrane protein YbhN (UPF0104 family)